MELTAGTRLGVYEVTGLLGAGGMGEVYRATDTRLKRDVAIKVLLPEVAQNPERLTRFEREAQILASLNHPSIAAIYGVEQAGDTTALVLEYVDGPTLADRIARGPIPLDEALPIARQIAEALETAHEKGIIHRDLKPANIKVRPDGTVKVLDFGLAKAREPGGTTAPSANLSNSPTLTSPALMTGVGVLLGTAAYMSPEQAKGRPADRRSDLWSFGCVLFEMLSGRRPFAGEDVSDTLAAILTREPEWGALPTHTPSRIREVLRRCLVRDRRDRLDSALAVRLELADNAWEPPLSGQVTSSPRARWIRLITAIAAGVLIGAPASMIVAGRLGRAQKSSPEPIPRRFEIQLPPGVTVADDVRQPIALADDGSVLAVKGAMGQRAAYYARYMNRGEFVAISGTERENGSALGSIFLSPDGRWLGFVDHSSSTLNKVPLAGGHATVLSRLTLPAGEDSFGGAVWSPRGDSIAFSQSREGLSIVSSEGGESRVLPRPELGAAFLPHFTPDGKAILFWNNRSATDDQIMGLVPVEGGAATQLGVTGREPTTIGPSTLLYAKGDQAWTVSLDAALSGRVPTPTLAFDGFRRYTRGVTPSAQFVAGLDGSVAYVPTTLAAGNGITEVETDTGRQAVLEGLTARDYAQVRVSPDGTKLALGSSGRSNHIWIYERRERTLARFQVRFADDRYPLWTRDSKSLVFTATEEGRPALFVAPIDASAAPRLLMKTSEGATDVGPEGWTPDGQALLFYEGRDSQTDLGLLPLKGVAPPSFQRRPASNEGGPRVSSAGVIAYHSSASGRFEIYAERFPEWTERVQVSVTGGRAPVWSADGKRVRWLTPDGRELWEAEVRLEGGRPNVSNRRRFATGVFASSAGPGRPLDVGPDGRMFVVAPQVADAGDSRKGAIVFLTDWAHRKSAAP